MYSNAATMYDFHNSTDNLKFWTEKRAINNFFCFSSDFDETWWNCSTQKEMWHRHETGLIFQLFFYV